MDTGNHCLLGAFWDNNRPYLKAVIRSDPAFPRGLGSPAITKGGTNTLKSAAARKYSVEAIFAATA